MADRSPICMTISCPLATRCKRAACHVPGETTLHGLETIHPFAWRPDVGCRYHEPLDEGDTDPLVAGGQGRSAAQVERDGKAFGCCLAGAAALLWLLVLVWPGGVS